MNDKLINDIKLYVATNTVGPSALRNQGAAGVIKSARDFLSQMDLVQFGTSSDTDFKTILDVQTNLLMKALPDGAQNWGAARKGINLFLREAFYNLFLNEKYCLNRAEFLYEIPLDSVIAERLKKIDFHLPEWAGLKRVTPEEEAKYQQAALEYAQEKNIARVHLDVTFWTEGR